MTWRSSSTLQADQPGFGVQFTNSSAIAALAKELEQMAFELEPEPDEQFERAAT